MENKTQEPKKRQKTVFSRQDKKILKLLAKRIIEERNKAGLSQQALANAIKKSRMEVFRIEKAEVAVPITTLAKIAKALEISLSALVS